MQLLARTSFWTCLVALLVLLATNTGCHSVRREAELREAKARYESQRALGTPAAGHAQREPDTGPPPVRGRARFVTAGKAEMDAAVSFDHPAYGPVLSADGWYGALEIGKLPPTTNLPNHFDLVEGAYGFEAQALPVGYDLSVHDRVWMRLHVTFLDGGDRWFSRTWFLDGELSVSWYPLLEDSAATRGPARARSWPAPRAGVQPSSLQVREQGFRPPPRDAILRGVARFTLKRTSADEVELSLELTESTDLGAPRAVSVRQGTAVVDVAPADEAPGVDYESRIPSPKDRGPDWQPAYEVSGVWKWSATKVPVTGADLVWVQVRAEFADPATPSAYGMRVFPLRTDGLPALQVP